MPRVKRTRNHQPQSLNQTLIVKGKITETGRLEAVFAQSWRLGLGLVGIIGAIAYLGNQAQAQITPDGSTATGVTGNDTSLTRLINGGVQQGINLFHSFAQFNVNSGQQVYFSDPGVTNILSRVTGNNISQILGTLGVGSPVAPGAANLFLINPNGILFGQGARLDLGGSFVATTANALQFPDGNRFSASDLNSPAPTLTVNPSALLFNQIAAASVTNQSTAGLQVPNGKTLSLIGGDVRLEGGILRASGGRIELGGLTEPGSIAIEGDNLKLTFPDNIKRGDVALTNGSIVDVVGGGGDIFINARNIDISGADTKVCGGIGASGSSCNSPDSGGSANNQAGNIVFNGTGTVSIKQSRIENNLNPGTTGNSGDIFDAIINRDNIFGSILIGGDSISLGDSAEVSTSSFGTGSAGIVFMKATGNLSVENSGIFSNMSSTEPGNAGGILLSGGSISLNNSKLQVRSDSTNGDAGIVFLEADGGSISANNSAISSDIRAGAVGNARGVKFQAGSVSLTDTTVSSSTYGTGNAGDLIVTADDSVNLVRSYVFNNVEAGGVGQGGVIRVTTRKLSLLNGSQLQTIVRGAEDDTPAGVGNAGGIGVFVRDAEITGINDNPADFNAGKPSLITSSSLGQGDAGLVLVLADRDVSVVGAGSAISSDILGEGVGDAGGVLIAARTLFIKDGGRVSVNNLNPQSGEAGAIIIKVRDLRLENQGFLGAVTLSGKGGNLILAVEDLLVLTKGSEISTTAGIAPGGGDGGNVFINTKYVFAVPVNDSNISAQAYGNGDGGRIDLDALKLYRIGPSSDDFINTNDITVSSRYGRTGEYRGNVLNTDPTQGLTNLPVDAVDPSRLIAQRCALRSRTSPNQENKFTVTQRGGLPSNPTETLQNESVVTNWVTLNSADEKPTGNTSSPAATQSSKSAQYVEAQGWVIDEKGQVVLTAQAPTATPHSPTLTSGFSCNGS